MLLAMLCKKRSSEPVLLEEASESNVLGGVEYNVKGEGEGKAP